MTHVEIELPRPCKRKRNHRLLTPIAVALLGASACIHPSTNIGRPTPLGRFALGVHKGLDRDWAAVMDPSVQHLKAIDGPASPVFEGLYRGVAVLPYTLVARWGLLSHWDVGLSLGASTGVDTRIALWQDESARAVVLTGDGYVGARQEVHSRLLWFEPVSSRFSLMMGGGLSNGKYILAEPSLGLEAIGRRREGRADAVLGVETRTPEGRLVIALNGYRVISHGQLEDLRSYSSEQTLSAHPYGVWVSFGIEGFFGKPFRTRPAR